MPDDDKPAEETSDKPDAKPEEAAAGGDAPASADEANPEAIARRVAALGDEDAIERLAREEELKLAERRRLQKGGGKKKGLEASAAKRLAKIGDKATAKKKTVARAVDADPLLDRANDFSKWARKNRNTVGGVIAAALVVGAGTFGYAYLQQRKEGEASVELARAVEDERGRVGDPDKVDEKQHDPRPVFKTAEDRRESALKKYREVIKSFPGTGAAILARLSEGSLLLDKHDSDGAMGAFNEVKASPLAAADAEVRGRALEGLGFAYELKGDLDNALKTFRELENTVDVLGFKELGLYHQARVSEAKGDKSKAIELLKTLHERLSKTEGHPFPYLQEVGDDRLRALDPTALPPRPPPGMGGGPGGMSPEEMKRLLEQLKKGGGGPPGK
jgi:hypothetical protein